jgi:hypothetical protein
MLGNLFITHCYRSNRLWNNPKADSNSSDILDNNSPLDSSKLSSSSESKVNALSIGSMKMNIMERTNKVHESSTSEIESSRDKNSSSLNSENPYEILSRDEKLNKAYTKEYI